MGLERPIGLESWWGLGAAHLKGAPKVGPIKAHLEGRPQAYISKGKGRGAPNPSPLGWPPPSLPRIKL